MFSFECKLSNAMDKFRDLRNYSGPASETKRKEIIKVSKDYDLSITNIRTVKHLWTTPTNRTKNPMMNRYI